MHVRFGHFHQIVRYAVAIFESPVTRQAQHKCRKQLAVDGHCLRVGAGFKMWRLRARREALPAVDEI
jgi:hypothetical protein